uniref:Uncharacterized protein n=1 Tax=Anguilla anguilla TaxID=7936 RepID=A0A0E9UN69_ANGAN
MARILQQTFRQSPSRNLCLAHL